MITPPAALVTVPPHTRVAPAPTRMTPAFAPGPVPLSASKVPPVSDRVAFDDNRTLRTVSLTPEVTVKADPAASRMALSDAPGTIPPRQSEGLVKLPFTSRSQWMVDIGVSLGQGRWVDGRAIASIAGAWSFRGPSLGVLGMLSPA